MLFPHGVRDGRSTWTFRRRGSDSLLTTLGSFGYAPALSGGPIKKQSVSAVFRALNKARVRYLVAGGLAVNAHGLLRFTADMDLVVQLIPDNVSSAFRALKSIGYRPIVPVTAEGFGDARTRKGWIRDKGMKVLQFYSDRHRETTVDVFVEEPFAFDKEHRNALVRALTGSIQVRFVSLPTLIKMKKSAARAKDLADLEDLRRLQGSQRARKR